MAQPPTQLRIKRRRSEDPVDSLFIRHDSKKRQTTANGFVYKRLKNDAPDPTPALPSDKSTTSEHDDQKASEETERRDQTQKQLKQGTSEPRRYTLVSTPGVRKRGAIDGIATFVEEKRQKLRPTPKTKTKTVHNHLHAAPAPKSTPTPKAASAAHTQAQTQTIRAPARTPSPQLVPAPTADPTDPHFFAQSFVSSPQSQSRGRKADIRNGKPRPPPPRLARSPDAKTKAFLATFAHELAEEEDAGEDTCMTDADAEDAHVGNAGASGNPGRAATGNGLGNSHEDGDDDMADSDYVYETYIRQELTPAPTATSQDSTSLLARTSASCTSSVYADPNNSNDPNSNSNTHPITNPDTNPPPNEIGYLIIHSSQDSLWESYAETPSDEEGDWDSEQDDENAENFYGADYPEDEVSEDDEFGRQDWKYRSRPADEEEFDLVEDGWSEDEDDNGRGSGFEGGGEEKTKGTNEFEFVGGRGMGVVD